MSTLNLYNVQKARFWDELLSKERQQSLKAVNAIKVIRTTGPGADDRPCDEIGQLIPGRSLKLAKRRASDAQKPAYLRKAPIVRMEPTIPRTTGKQYQRLKNGFRPQTAPAGRTTQKADASGGDSGEYGLDPRFASQVGYHLFGFSDIQPLFPIKDKVKAKEFPTHSELQDSLTMNDRKTFHPYEIYKRPVTASQDVGWDAFDPAFYKNRTEHKALVHPLKSSEMTIFAAAMISSGRG